MTPSFGKLPYGVGLRVRGGELEALPFERDVSWQPVLNHLNYSLNS